MRQPSRSTGSLFLESVSDRPLHSSLHLLSSSWALTSTKGHYVKPPHETSFCHCWGTLSLRVSSITSHLILTTLNSHSPLGPNTRNTRVFNMKPMSDHIGWGKVGLQFWARETEFILVLLLINYCIIFHRTTVNLLLPHPVCPSVLWLLGNSVNIHLILSDCIGPHDIGPCFLFLSWFFPSPQFTHIFLSNSFGLNIVLCVPQI